MAVRVKICGVGSLADARAAVASGAWAIGFNFVPSSPRFIEPSRAASIAAAVSGSVALAGVFVDEPRDRIAATVDQVGLSILQFHGDESPADCDGWKLQTIKALRVRDHTAVESAAGYPVDFILADAYVEGAFGGTGRRLDLALLEGFDPRRLLVAGGLTPDNVAEVVRRLRPFGVDVASGIERQPGQKDHRLIRSFLDNANAA